MLLNLSPNVINTLNILSPVSKQTKNVAPHFFFVIILQYKDPTLTDFHRAHARSYLQDVQTRHS